MKVITRIALLKLNETDIPSIALHGRNSYFGSVISHIGHRCDMTTGLRGRSAVFVSVCNWRRCGVRPGVTAAAQPQTVLNVYT